LRHLFFSPSVVLTEAINIFNALAEPDDEEDNLMDEGDGLDGSASGVSRYLASLTLAVVPPEKLRRFTDLLQFLPASMADRQEVGSCTIPANQDAASNPDATTAAA
jgi:hypothetical protein